MLVVSAWEKRFYWWSWSKLFDQYQNLFWVRAKRASTKCNPL